MYSMYIRNLLVRDLADTLPEYYEKYCVVSVSAPESKLPDKLPDKPLVMVKRFIKW